MAPQGFPMEPVPQFIGPGPQVQETQRVATPAAAFTPPDAQELERPEEASRDQRPREQRPDAVTTRPAATEVQRIEVRDMDTSDTETDDQVDKPRR